MSGGKAVDNTPVNLPDEALNVGRRSPVFGIHRRCLHDPANERHWRTYRVGAETSTYREWVCGLGMGWPLCAMPSRWKAIASRISRSTSSLVRPVTTH